MQTTLLIPSDTETQRSPTYSDTQTQMQDRGVRWMWIERCGGASVCQRRPCRRTRCQQASPDTPPVFREHVRRECLWLLFAYRYERQSNGHESSTNSKTGHWARGSSRQFPLSFWFPCKSVPQTPTPSSPPPSSSGQSDHLYTALASSGGISLGDESKTARLSPESLLPCLQTERDICVLCLSPGWVHKHLMGRTRNYSNANTDLLFCQMCRPLIWKLKKPRLSVWYRYLTIS